MAAHKSKLMKWSVLEMNCFCISKEQAWGFKCKWQWNYRHVPVIIV